MALPVAARRSVSRRSRRVVGLARVAPGETGLLGQVAQIGAVARDHRVHGGRHDRRDRGHDEHLTPLDRRVLGRAHDEERDQQGQVETEQADQQVQPTPVEREPHNGQQVDHDESRVAAALGVADDGEDRHVADGDDQPRPVGQPLPRQQEGRGDEDEEEKAGDGDLAPGFVREGDDSDEHRADGDEREEGEAHPHGAREADRERRARRRRGRGCRCRRAGRRLRFAPAGRHHSGLGRRGHRLRAR